MRDGLLLIGAVLVLVAGAAAAVVVMLPLAAVAHGLRWAWERLKGVE